MSAFGFWFTIFSTALIALFIPFDIVLAPTPATFSAVEKVI